MDRSSTSDAARPAVAQPRPRARGASTTTGTSARRRALANGGRLFDRYRLEERLGRGGMAEVWRAHDERLDRTVAIKLLHPHLLPDAAARTRFVAEARAAAGLSDPGIVPVYDVIDDDETPAIVFQYVPGESLDDALRRAGALPLSETVAIGSQVARALDHAHSAGLIHRDVKPGNILLEVGGGARLVDFGIARLLADAAARSTSTGEIMGTLRYMSPEQLLGQEADARSDLYSLGLTLFEMASGRPAFDAKTPVALLQAEQAGPPPLPEQPKWFAALVAALLTPDADRRPQSAAAVAAELERGATGDPSAAVRDDAPLAAAAFPGVATAGAGLVPSPPALDARPTSPVPLESDPTIVMTGPVERPVVEPPVVSSATPEAAPVPAQRTDAATAVQPASQRRRMGTRVGLLAIVLVVLVGGSVLAGWANLGHSAGLASPTLGPAPTVGSQPAVVVTPDAKPAGHKGGKKGHR